MVKAPDVRWHVFVLRRMCNWLFTIIGHFKVTTKSLKINYRHEPIECTHLDREFHPARLCYQVQGISTEVLRKEANERISLVKD